jgi:hypothetical protein
MAPRQSPALAGPRHTQPSSREQTFVSCSLRSDVIPCTVTSASRHRCERVWDSGAHARSGTRSRSTPSERSFSTNPVATASHSLSTVPALARASIVYRYAPAVPPVRPCTAPLVRTLGLLGGSETAACPRRWLAAVPRGLSSSGGRLLVLTGLLGRCPHSYRPPRDGCQRRSNVTRDSTKLTAWSLTKPFGDAAAPASSWSSVTGAR